MCEPYARLTSSCVVFPQAWTISFALHRRKISPTASWSCGGWELGKCQGELKVSVSAKCCSAMTRREMRWACQHTLAYRLGSGVRTDLSIVDMNLSVSSGFIRPRTSSTPMAKRGITVACSVSVSSKILQYLSFSSRERMTGTLRKRSKARRYDSYT